jgi:putative Holliday junction resolvase
MLCTLNELASYRSLQKRLMGVDFGDKTIGVSLCDITWIIASPLTPLTNQGKAKTIDALWNLFQTHNCCAFVFGFPLNMNGSEGPQAQKVKAFVGELLKRHPVPILLWDERLSTQAVTRTMIAADLSRKRQKEVVDKMAASYILQGVLDALR